MVIICHAFLVLKFQFQLKIKIVKLCFKKQDFHNFHVLKKVGYYGMCSNNCVTRFSFFFSSNGDLLHLLYFNYGYLYDFTAAL